MSLSFRYLKILNLKETKIDIFLISIGSEFQSHAPAFWEVFLPEEVLVCRGPGGLPYKNGGGARRTF